MEVVQDAQKMIAGFGASRWLTTLTVNAGICLSVAPEIRGC